MSLSSIYKQRNEEKNLQETMRVTRQLYPYKSEMKLQAMSAASMKRIHNQARETLNSKELTKVLSEGTIPLKHPIHHDFRPREKSQEFGDMNMYQRTYLPAKDRADKTAEDIRQAILEKGPFRPKVDLMVRKDVKEKHIVPVKRYDLRTENERIRAEIEKNCTIDHSAKDTKMVYYPDWKEVKKENWTTVDYFNSTNNMFQGKKSDTAWPIYESGLAIGNPYKDGYEVIGDLSRKREKDKEANKKQFFHSTVTNGFRHLDDKSTSIRNYKHQQLQALAESNNLQEKLYIKTMKQIKSLGELGDIMEGEANTSIQNNANLQQQKLRQTQTAKIIRESTLERPVSRAMTSKKSYGELQFDKELSGLQFTHANSILSNIPSSTKNIEYQQNSNFLKSNNSLFHSNSSNQNPLKQKNHEITEENIKKVIGDYFEIQK